MKELEKIIKCVSLVTKAKIIHSFLLLITMYGIEHWTVKKTDRKKAYIHNMMLEESFVNILDRRKDKQVAPESNQTRAFLKSKNNKTETAILWTHYEKEPRAAYRTLLSILPSQEPCKVSWVGRQHKKKYRTIPSPSSEVLSAQSWESKCQDPTLLSSQLV
ncbi:GPI inositol-deacylase [Varanus komodoensis]|nr:GPI inositol-deacylase [Varanus komodoensis]